ncbi:MAG: hypothetical protein U9R57_14195 [Thermodesulfobacteriota bacterium]|nr:hypothetical protein [Thermodesulfobacteriota bacterium]
MSLNGKVLRCQKVYEDHYTKLLQNGYSEIAAVESCAHNYLDGKPSTKGLTLLDRSVAFWKCSFWQTIPTNCYDLNAVAFALSRAIHSGMSDFTALERIIQRTPELLKRGIRYSQVFLRHESPLWLTILSLSRNSSEDFKTFVKVCDRLRETLSSHDKIIENLKAQLVELTVFEFLLYGSLFAFQNLVPEKFNNTETDTQKFEKMQENSDILNQLLVWKLKTRPENDFRLNERFLANSLKRHLIPLILPTERTPALCTHNLDVFTSLTKAMVDRNNFWNRTIMQFCFDDDYLYKFDGDHLTIYPHEIPNESDWDRNGRKLNILHQYWLNRALIEYAISELDDTPFGNPENDAGNREAYINATQLFLQLNEIYGLDDKVKVSDSHPQGDIKAAEAILSF